MLVIEPNEAKEFLKTYSSLREDLGKRLPPTIPLFSNKVVIYAAVIVLGQGKKHFTARNLLELTNISPASTYRAVSFFIQHGILKELESGVFEYQSGPGKNLAGNDHPL